MLLRRTNYILFNVDFIIVKIVIVKKIANEADYKSVMAKINKLMSKGSEKVSKTELAQIRKLALVVQQYEQTKFSIKASTTLEGIDNGDFLLNAI